MSTATHARRRWMSVVAKADCAELEALCGVLGPLPAFEWLRRPESGLAMVRGRIGGTGAKFNVGEISLTRCALRIDSGVTGFAYVQGRSARHAELAAIVDALMQDPGRRDDVDEKVVSPLESLQRDRTRRDARRAAATRVDFYTVVRGENT